MSDHHDLDLTSFRASLAGTSGPEYWRSLEELANTEAFQEYLHREFPEQASEFTDPVGRRQFLRLMGASLALAGVSACTKQPAEVIVPYVRAPEELVPGKPLFYATAVTFGGYATGVLVESHEGRPTKIEGNPEHPASLGATDLFAQAQILALYDPDRSQTIKHQGDIRTWSTFLGALRGVIEAKRSSQGAGLRILTGTVTSPTLARQMAEFLEAFPSAKWHQHEAAGRDNARGGARLAFGAVVDTRYAFDKARVVVSLDAEFLGTMAGSVRYIRDFSATRRVRGEAGGMSRLYAVESAPGSTGAKADHRAALRPAEIETFARALAAAVGVPGAPAATVGTTAQKMLDAAARDLLASKGASIVVPGDEQPPAVHAICHAINGFLGNTGITVLHTDPVASAPLSQLQSLRDLVDDIDSGRVDALLVLGGNPVYDAPSDVRFGDALKKVAFTARLGFYEDETSAACQWHIPEAHALEAWSDARAWDGTATIVQPLIAPLYAGKSAHDMLIGLSQAPGRAAYDVVRDTWKQAAASAGALDAEQYWRTAVHDGVVKGTAFPLKAVTPGNVFAAIGAPAPGAPGLDLVLRADPTVHDGRFANLGWLQELPKPFTKLT